MKVEYSSNNSGGRWWLQDRHWIMLEEAGWQVEWGGTYNCGSEFSFNKRPESKPDCGKGKQCPGHIKFDSHREMKKEDRFLGALAQHASKEFDSITPALKEFESITGLRVSDDGCNCCGAPHSFTWSSHGCIDGTCDCEGPHKDYNWASGSDCLQYLYEDVPGSFREAVEKLNSKN